MPLFETRSLCKHYRSARGRALDDVTMSIDAGGIVLIAGPSGSGKTTLLALLGAMERPTSGQVLFDGKDLGACSEAERTRVRRRLGFVFQDFCLIPNLTVEENVTYPLIPRGIPDEERRRRATEALARFGLEHRLKSKGRELSGGEQQRVAVARALAGRPEVLLADEPTSNLDQETTAAFLAAMREIQSEGRTVVLTSHDPRAAVLATVRHELVAGRLIESSATG